MSPLLPVIVGYRVPSSRGLLLLFFGCLCFAGGCSCVPGCLECRQSFGVFRRVLVFRCVGQQRCEHAVNAVRALNSFPLVQPSVLSVHDPKPCGQRSSDLSVSEKKACKARRASLFDANCTALSVCCSSFFQPLGNSSLNLTKQPLPLGDAALTDQRARHDVAPVMLHRGIPCCHARRDHHGMFCMMMSP